MGFKDRVALVTGSSRGIGRAIALALAEAGADVVVHCRNRVAKAAEVAEMIRRKGRESLVCRADLSSKSQTEQVFKEISAQFGRLDILVNNAAHAMVKPFMSLSVEDWDRQFAVLPRGYFLCCKYGLPLILRSGKGAVLNIVSTTGVRGEKNETAYGAANGAVCALTRSLAREFGPKEIRVNALLVAWAVTTDNPFDYDDVDHRDFLDQLSLKVVTDPDDIARAAVFLCSDAAEKISGVLLPVDSGYLA